MIAPGTATLAQMALEVAFFTHGALFTYGGFDFDPVRDFVEGHPGCAIGAVEVPFVLFAGLEPQGWTGNPFNRLLFTCPHPFWTQLSGFLRGVSAADRIRRRFVRATTHQIEVVDAVAMSRIVTAPARLPCIPVTAVGVDATDVHLAFSQRPDREGQVGLVFRPRNPQTLQMARAILGDDPDRPFVALEQEAPLVRIRGTVTPTPPAYQPRAMLLKGPPECPTPPLPPTSS